MLYDLLIAPIETIVDWVFLFLCRLTNGYSVIFPVIGVSLVINFLALPLYNIADSLQEKERKITRKMENRVKRIKKGFKGDEQFMILSTYYRQNDYHPLYVLRSSLSILIEIPFFIAAYHYLSNCKELLGNSFWIFKDLGKPDTLFTIPLFGKALVINVLPILMTLINFVSGAIYTKDAPAKEKVQLYIVALIFLVLLYNSPSGLVIYWILNNLFSLVKNVVMKQKHPGRILYFSILGLCAALFIFLTIIHFSMKKVVVSIAAMVILCIPLLWNVVRRGKPALQVKKLDLKLDSTNFLITVLAGLAISLLAGFLLPSSVIASSPAEFSFLGNTDNPISYVKTAFCVFLGLFCLWPACIYKMFGEKVKKYEPFLLFSLTVIFLVNAFILKSDYGNLSVWYRLDDVSVLHKHSLLMTSLTVLTVPVAAGIYLLFDRLNWRNFAAVGLFAICIAEAGLGFVNARKINTEFEIYKADLERAEAAGEKKVEDVLKPVIHLSKTEQNVVVLFLDRAMSSFFPEVLEELPQLRDQFEGFTYYPNSMSFSTNTNISSPQIFGGYEYTPVLLNERSDELLKDKHNEALRVMPSLFEDGGYDVSIFDPPSVNYNWRSDMSVLNEGGRNFNLKRIEGFYSELCKQRMGLADEDRDIDVISRKELRNFSMLQILPVDFRETFYSNFTSVQQTATDFIASFSTLYFLNNLTDFTSENPVFIYLDNEITHRPQSLIAPEYEVVDETRHNFEKNPKMNILVQEHYDSFAAGMIKIGNWLDYLRENDVYDNTRIVIVADHGYEVPLEAFDYFSDSTVPSHFNILLLEKDFNSNEPLSESDEFMTTADTLFMAKEGLGLSDINPETGKTLTQEKEGGITAYIQKEGEWNVTTMKNKYQFTLEENRGWHVSDNLFEEENWIPIAQYESASEGN